MEKIAFYITPEEIPYFGPIVRCLPPELVDVHIGSTHKHIRDFQGFDSHVCQSLDELAGSGYKLIPMEPDSLGNYGCVAMTSMFIGPMQSIFDWQRQKHERLVFLIHSVEDACYASDFASSFYILAHQRQAETHETNKVIRRENPDLFKRIMAWPRKWRNEFATAGLYHLGEWAEKRHAPRDQLKAELEQALGKDLDPDKPVVFALEALHCHVPHFKTGLEQLAPHVNLVVKPLSGMDIPGAYMWHNPSYAPNLPRFAADYILAGYHSGTLASSTMLGLKVIPFYTRKIQMSFPWMSPQYLITWEQYTQSEVEKGSLTPEILEKLNTPVDIMDTASILKRLASSHWWRHYASRLPEVQRQIFGMYEIEKAPAVAATMLIKVLLKDTFGEASLAVQPRVEYAQEIEAFLRA